MTLRMGELVEADGAFEAWTSGDLDQMVDALDLPTNPIDRHFLLQNIVQKTYKERDIPKARRLCRRVAEIHLSEFSDIAPALKKDMGGFLPRVSTFQHYATVLTEDGEFDRAVEVCEQAMEYGLDDGTKTGFEGRINRIQRKAKKARE